MKFKITLLLLITAMGYAQVTNQGKPVSWKTKNLENIVAVAMPQFDLKELQKKDSLSYALGGPLHFAKEFTVNYNLQNSGSWHILSNGDRIWRIRITSAGAKAMHFWFRNAYLPEGATVYVYNAAHTDLIGAFDSRENKNSSGYFGSWPLEGDDAWIEYFEPKAQIGQGRLEIFKVGHSYRPFYTTIAEGDALTTFSASCNYDVECFVEGIDNVKNITKHSVTRLLASVEGGAFLCSGALINTTANDGTPYVLSANHCYEEGALYMYRFNWVNPNPACPSSGSGDDSINSYQVISGSELKARRTESDFMLQELSADLPGEWNVVWSGWDRTTEIPPFTYGVHHPAGDIMKVTLDQDPPVLPNDPEHLVWELDNFELGTLEGGSSGSPLLDNNGRIRGQAWYIFGAGFGCDGNHGNIGAGYGRLDKSWDTGTTPQTRLSDWLDPLNTGATKVDFYPPQQIYTLDAKALLFDAGHEVCGTTAAPIIRLENYGTQTLTSLLIEYTVNGGAPQLLNWSGSLAMNQDTLINLPEITGATGENTIVVTLLNPNGQADDNVANNAVTITFTPPGVYEPQVVTLSLVTDLYGDEISWDLTGQNGEVLYSVSHETYDNEQSYTEELNLPLDGCYTFTIYDDYGDGICCGQGQGHYSLTTASGAVIASGGDYTTFQATTFKMDTPMGTGTIAMANALVIYPNPSAGMFTVKTGDMLGGQQYSICNMLGQVVKTGVLTGTETSVNLSGMANGIYLLKVNGTAGSFKLIKK